MPEHDVVVVGGGAAGLRAALAAQQAGANVAVVSKLHPVRSHTAGTRAGINAALGSDDSWQQHAADTVRASDYLGDQDAIAVLCQEAPQEIVVLDHMGALFNRGADKQPLLRRLSGSGQARSCFCDDLTGHILLQVLYEQVLKAQITTYDEWFVTSLLLHDGACRGVVAWDMREGTVQALHAKAVILATGNAAQVYAPNAASLACTGDGVSLAAQAGAALLDMEMVQYHPLTMGRRKAVPVTRGLLAAGAHLVNAKGERFMTTAASAYAELAAADVCARGIYQEIEAGRGQDGTVLLDATQVDAGLLKRQFPETLTLAKKLTGVDLTKAPLPVRPAVQAILGGIAADIDGATTVAGLFAAGECANVGVRGAGELAGNTLMESLVFGRRAGAAAAAAARQATGEAVPATLLSAEEQRLQALLQLQDSGEDTPARVRAELGELMQAKAGWQRDATGLSEAAAAMEGLRQRQVRLRVRAPGLVFNYELQAVLELSSLLQVASATLAAAAARQESRGTHVRTDFPERDDTQWLQHTVTTVTAAGCTVETRPVRLTDWQPQRRTY